MGIRRRINLALQAVGIEPPSRRQLRFGRILHSASIDVILDIGANTGSFAVSTRHSGYRGLLVSFEPLEEAHRILVKAAANDPLWLVAPRIALGREDGETVIHVSANSVSSSLLPMADAHVNAAPESKYVGDDKVLVRRLDEVAKELVPDVASKGLMLKIDTQGYEFPVLEGSKELLEHTRVIQLELSLTELYEGQSLIWEVMDFLRKYEFELWMISEEFVNEQSGRLLQVDGLFVKKGVVASANGRP
ncbi:MAG: FkbM family methyltransferase [Fimbriimonadaceae bacterium]